MFGSEALAIHVDNVAKTIPAVVSAVGDRRVPGSVAPSFVTLPALLFHPQALAYGGEIGAGVSPAEQEGTYVVRFLCDGWDSAPIRAAAVALFAALTTTHSAGVVTIDDETYAVTLLADSEWPQPILIDAKTNTVARCLGTIFRADVMKG